MADQTLPTGLRVFPRMLGRWHGSRLSLDPTGRIEARGTIDVDAKFVDGRWVQTNAITLEGRPTASATVTARFDDAGVFHLDTPRVVGTGREVGDSVVVVWSLRSDPSMTFEELISYRGDNARARTWHHFKDDRLVGVTLMQETRVE